MRLLAPTNAHLLLLFWGRNPTPAATKMSTIKFNPRAQRPEPLNLNPQVPDKPHEDCWPNSGTQHDHACQKGADRASDLLDASAQHLTHAPHHPHTSACRLRGLGFLGSGFGF